MAMIGIMDTGAVVDMPKIDEIEALDARLAEMGVDNAIGVGYQDEAGVIHCIPDDFVDACESGKGVSEIVIDSGHGVFVSCPECMRLMIEGNEIRLAMEAKALATQHN